MNETPKIDGWYSMHDMVQMLIEHRRKDNSWYIDFVNAKTYIAKLRALRKYYEQNILLIEDAFNESGTWYDAYCVDWNSLFTPIEEFAWNSIRCKGRLVLYPQFPAGPYFIDFANPVLRVGIELDGKKYHNKEKDLIRDRELSKDNWVIFRITGSEMNNLNYKTFGDEIREDSMSEKNWDDIRHWILNTGDGVMEAAKMVYFKGGVYQGIYDRFMALCYESLTKHCLIRW